MKILYGVQATGNGHITRARSMATELRKAHIDVDYLFTGRHCDRLFNMDCFGDYRCLPGLTLRTHNGKLNYLKTAINNRLLRWLVDSSTLDVSGYDLIITDFEPVSAWAARLKGKPVLGISHQYAFQYNIPMVGNNPATAFIMRHFAPTRWSLGVHWHHFDCPILPPLIEPVSQPLSVDSSKILVYLPFEAIKRVTKWLNCQNQKSFQFMFYCSVPRQQQQGDVTLKPFSRANFQQDLASCNGVIANAGFGLASEALQHGKKLLVKPLHGQMEQLSNAAALRQLKLGDTMQTLDSPALSTWLNKDNPAPVHYPNVAYAIVQWIKRGMNTDIHTFTRKVWNDNEPSMTATTTPGNKVFA